MIVTAGVLTGPVFKGLFTFGPTIFTLHEFIVPALIIELHYICSVCLG